MAQLHDRASELHARPSVRTLRLEGLGADDPAAAALLGAAQDVDPLSDVLRMVKLTGALFFLVDARRPWGIEVPEADEFAAIILPNAQHIVSYHIILEGSGWTEIPNVGSTWFEAGDILVFAHGDPYSMLSEPGQQCEFDTGATLQFFRDMAAGKLPFVVREGGAGKRARFACGYLGCDIRPFNPVLAALPRLLHVRRSGAPREGLLDRLIELTLAEARSRRVGSDCIRLRLSELMFVVLMRRYFESLPPNETGWLSGLRDPVIGRVLSMLHDSPAQAWTLRELAERAGASRAVLAERFTHLVGCPPMQYLARWRMQIAARFLADSSMKVAAVAHAVGYESEAAFSRAFKKATGVSPAVWPTRRIARRRGREPSARPR